MSSILQSPDSLNLAGNLKKIIVSSAEEVSFVLQQGSTVILEEIYQPGTSGLATIDVKAVIDRLLTIELPSTGGTFIQAAGVGDFTATEKDNKVFGMLNTFINWIIPNFKAGGGKFT
jgi:hypothetical protein